MRNLMLMLVSFTSVITHAQNVAINNDASLPDNSAILDIKSGTKGLLIPRMNTAAIAAIVNPAKGLLVLDTAKNQLLVNMGTPAVPNWQTIVAASGWGLNGNSGIDSTTNFIGTTNTKPFIMRVNNVRAGYLDTITNNTSLGFRALDSFTIGNSNTAFGFKTLSSNNTGSSNTGLGWSALRSNSSGGSNTAIGNGSLFKNLDGYSNVAIGVNALYNNTNGYNLVAIGDSSLYNNGIGATNFNHGFGNTAVGSKALFSNNTGYQNTSIGWQTLYSNLSGQSNVAVGSGALYSNTTGNGNTSVGAGSMSLNTSGFWNSVYGYSSLTENSTGRYNSVFGARSMDQNTTGNTNTAIGVFTLFNNVTGYSNVAIGAYVLANNNNRSNLVAIGDSALFNNGLGATQPEHGIGNTAVGSKALYNNTTGYQNTAIGFNTLLSNSGGTKNVALGFNSLKFNTTGASNTSTGFNSLVLNSTGNDNSAYGLTSMSSNTTGSDNSSFGSGSLPSNTIGSLNTAIGKLTLWSNSSGNHNTAVGGYALNNNVTGSFNTGLGTLTRVGLTNLNYATAIGAFAQVNCSYCLVLGPTYDVNGNPINVNVGIGTVAPDAPLTFGDNTGKKIVLYGSGASNQFGIGIQDGLMQIHSDYATSDIAFGYGSSDAGFTERMRIKGDGNVGIGTTTPSVPLSFDNNFGTKISLYHGSYGHVGIGVHTGELRLQNDIPNGKVTLGVIETTGTFTELAKAERNGAYAFSIFGLLWANGMTYGSDERFKKNITPITSALQKVLQINGVEYEMNSTEFAKNNFQTGRQIGLIAQNVEKIVPGVVSEMDGYKGVDYAKLVPLLIEGIKEQQKQIDEMKKEQQKQIGDLKKEHQKQIDDLKKLVEERLKK